MANDVNDFPFFQRLPYEIRQQIWELSIPDWRFQVQSGHYAALFDSQPRNRAPALLHTCQESRNLMKMRFGRVRIGYEEELDERVRRGMRFGPSKNWNGTVEWVDWHNDLFADIKQPNENVVRWKGSRGRILDMDEEHWERVHRIAILGASFSDLLEDQYYCFDYEVDDKVVTQQSICKRLHETGYCRGRLPELKEILILRFRDNGGRQPWLRIEGEILAVTQEGVQRWLKEGCQICKITWRSSVNLRVTVGELLFPTTRGLCPKPTAVDLMDIPEECTNPDFEHPTFYMGI